ncbi:MAG: GntR family transcriptional regulator [Rhodospirillales bacterium]|nr:GntR family transcriptional regulator [Rhodospirillales bacterium]MDE2200592.1 GntR family transcriptional regulator [Rhodospirillales bacterium]MDE2574500.1 GntR family transcriptional regulator [Rhodospirillales bacterium]
MATKPSHRPPRTGGAVRELRRRIVMNELAPGAVLTELALAEQLGVGQGAIREALLRLEGEGLVSRSGRQGTMVTNLDRATAEEILALRRRIEMRAAGRVVRGLGASDIAALHTLMAAMHDHAVAGDGWAMIESDTEFHLALFRPSGLAAMEAILARCIMHTHRFRLWAPWHNRPLARTAGRHAPILAAAEARDAAALEAAIGEHLDTIVETTANPEARQ